MKDRVITEWSLGPACPSVTVWPWEGNQLLCFSFFICEIWTVNGILCKQKCVKSFSAMSSIYKTCKVRIKIMLAICTKVRGGAFSKKKCLLFSNGLWIKNKGKQMRCYFCIREDRNKIIVDPNLVRNEKWKQQKH